MVATAGVRAIVLDVEGTTTPIAFVHQTLFPYARRHLRAYLQRHASSSDGVRLVEGLKREHAAEPASDKPPVWREESPESTVESAVAYALWLMDRDRKSRGLKEVQGKVWEDGYRSGELIGQVFPDVRPALEHWHRAGTCVGIFSSGSVLAQQLLFRHSSAGDLTPLLRWHFDTAIGGKGDPASYRRIAATIAIPADAILFLSDVVFELDAAREAGMRAVLSDRPGNSNPPRDHGYPVVSTLSALIV